MPMPDDWNQKAQLGQTHTQYLNADAYDQHRAAVTEWHQACKEFVMAETRRSQAKAALEKTSQALTDVLQISMQDPTQPQVPPPNGNLVPGASSRRF